MRDDGSRGRGRQSARCLPGLAARAPRLFIGSHLDTVVRAGAFDGVLGVVLAIAIVDGLEHRRLPFTIEVVGFSEEEGVRFGVPFIGSRALVGSADEALLGRRDAHGRSIADAIRDYGLDPSNLARAARRRGRDRLPRIPHRAGPRARRPRSPARCRGRDRRAEPRHDDVHRIGESRRNHADARPPGCAGGCRGVDWPGRTPGAGHARSGGNRRTHHDRARRRQRDRGQLRGQSRRAAWRRRGAPRCGRDAAGRGSAGSRRGGGSTSTGTRRSTSRQSR